jgi:hypothetical protein
MFRRVVTAGVAMAVLAVAMTLASLPTRATDGGPMFPQCPAIGADTGCQILLTIGPGGAVNVQTDPNQGAYDGIEDALVGVLNNSGKAVTSLALSGSGGIFGFDGDGLCAFDANAPEGCFGPTGYEGPGTSFTFSDVNTGSVNFAAPGLASGASAYFSLEGTPYAVTQACTNSCTVTDSAPGVSVTVTVNFNGSGTVMMVIGGTPLVCSSQFFTAPSTTTLNVTGDVVGNKAVQLVIDHATVVKMHGGNAGLSHYDVCYSSPVQFKDISGHMVNTGFLANCSNTTPAPCLVSKAKDQVGDVVENFVAPPVDPRFN